MSRRPGDSTALKGLRSLRCIGFRNPGCAVQLFKADAKLYYEQLHEGSCLVILGMGLRVLGY